MLFVICHLSFVLCRNDGSRELGELRELRELGKRNTTFMTPWNTSI
ncbi:MAG: hypothetical protein F6J86_18265 [Symploca sp. SIO1B1]|nr:hypothetical protein [Symploca sp. SIO1C2]NER95754.1 hypothetical protein [Symploca sp. SIO1B1]